jgi:predicted phosphoribosyltransferase
MRFRDRRDAGRQLAAQLSGVLPDRPVVLALPRGGVPVGAEVAKAHEAPLDVFVARKVGAPGHPEFGIGAIAEGGAVVADERSLRHAGVTPAHFDELANDEHHELVRRVQHYRGDRRLPPLDAVVLVDDGLATGVTAEAAIQGLRRLGAEMVILAVPVGAADTIDRLATIADSVVSVLRPDDFRAVGEWYDDFTQTSDDEVLAALRGPGPAS